MNVATIGLVREELERALKGRRFGKIFQLSRSDIVVDFRLPESQYLFLSIEPTAPRIYLVKRKVRELEKLSIGPSPFVLFLRKRLSGAEVTGIRQIENERALIIEFAAETDLEGEKRFGLAVQLTGRSANLFLLNERDAVLDSARPTKGDGQQVGEVYRPPVREGKPGGEMARKPFAFGSASISEELDRHYLEREAEQRFLSLAGSAKAKLNQEIRKRERLIVRLNGDLREHGDAEMWKRYGDLLLANLSTAARNGEIVTVTDYFDERLPKIEIPVESNESLTEAAERYFKRYTKARNAAEEIARRLESVEAELDKLRLKKDRLEEAIETRDEDYLKEFLGVDKPRGREGLAGKQSAANSGTRSFMSSDGFEILVGKKARDNDFLTFRIARSLDLWMHAADYPGSHVVVRNPDRREIPQRTLLEAAQLAAFYSQAKSQPKAAVHYTQKKHVNKPRGGAPGLVSLSSFKTILVEPKVPEL